MTTYNASVHGPIVQNIGVDFLQTFGMDLHESITNEEVWSTWEYCAEEPESGVEHKISVLNVLKSLHDIRNIGPIDTKNAATQPCPIDFKTVNETYDQHVRDTILGKEKMDSYRLPPKDIQELFNTGATDSMKAFLRTPREDVYRRPGYGRSLDLRMNQIVSKGRLEAKEPEAPGHPSGIGGNIWPKDEKSENSIYDLETTPPSASFWPDMGPGKPLTLENYQEAMDKMKALRDEESRIGGMDDMVDAFAYTMKHLLRPDILIVPPVFIDRQGPPKHDPAWSRRPRRSRNRQRAQKRWLRVGIPAWWAEREKVFYHLGHSLVLTVKQKKFYDQLGELPIDCQEQPHPNEFLRDMFKETYPEVKQWIRSERGPRPPYARSDSFGRLFGKWSDVEGGREDDWKKARERWAGATTSSGRMPSFINAYDGSRSRSSSSGLTFNIHMSLDRTSVEESAKVPEDDGALIRGGNLLDGIRRFYSRDDFSEKDALQTLPPAKFTMSFDDMCPPMTSVPEPNGTLVKDQEGNVLGVKEGDEEK